jgi:hypothetical protein
MSALFEARATKERVLHLRECAEYVFPHRRMALAKGSIELIESNYFQNVQKGECLLDDFEALRTLISTMSF